MNRSQKVANAAQRRMSKPVYIVSDNFSPVRIQNQESPQQQAGRPISDQTGFHLTQPIVQEVLRLLIGNSIIQ